MIAKSTIGVAYKESTKSQSLGVVLSEFEAFKLFAKFFCKTATSETKT